MVYHARWTDKYCYTLYIDESVLGQLKYKNGFSTKAEINLNNEETFTFTPKGFWGSSIELHKDLKLLAELKMKWNGKMTIQYFIQDQVYVYTLQHQGFFKNSYLLLDPAGHGLIHITVDSTWNKNNYEFQCSEVFALISNHILLLFTSLFGVQQYYKRMEG